MLGPPLMKVPRGPAARHAEGWWSAKITGTVSVVPDGGVDLMWTRGRAPWLAGPDTKPHVSGLDRGSTVVGVRLRPGVAAAMVSASVEQLIDSRVPVEEIWPGYVVRELTARLEEAMTVASAVQILADGLVAQVPAKWEVDPLVTDTVPHLRAGRPVSEFGVGVRQHRRRFAAAMGYGPKFFARTCRLDHFMCLVDAGARRSLASMAIAAGYSDQSHLTRDCVGLTGMTPVEVRAARDRFVQDTPLASR